MAIESFHEQETTVENQLAVTLSGIVYGKAACDATNYMLMNTFAKCYLRIGGKPYRVVKLTPQPSDMIRFSIQGIGSIVLPFYTELEWYVAGNKEEYHMGFQRPI